MVKKDDIDQHNTHKSRISKFAIKKPYAILVPGGSRNRKNKRWDFNNFLEIIKFLEKKDIISVLVGGHDEKDIFQNKSNRYEKL